MQRAVTQRFACHGVLVSLVGTLLAHERQAAEELAQWKAPVHVYPAEYEIMSTIGYFGFTHNRLPIPGNFRRADKASSAPGSSATDSWFHHHGYWAVRHYCESRPVAVTRTNPDKSPSHYNGMVGRN